MAAEPIAASLGDVADPALRLVPPPRDRVATLAGRQEGASAARRDLEFIEAALGRRIKRPARLTDDEFGFIAYVRATLEYGDATLRLQWLGLPVERSLAKRLLKDFAGGIVRSLRLASETGERLSLFGAGVPLGPTTMAVPQVRLANEQAVRAWLAGDTATEDSYTLRFATDQVDTVRFWYPDWLPGGRFHTNRTGPPKHDHGDASQIVIDFPGRWRVEVSAERSGFADLLDNAVLVAIEHLDCDEREEVFTAFAILFGWRPERERRWSSRRLPDTDYLFLQLTDRLGLVVRPGEADAPPRVVEVVRPAQLRSYQDGE
ncbi:MAG TPA: hypothetical protein VFW96_28245 [Thermomicrobiales bacterium]|nr:hypothetical protein [Thermomicrobiales bacterium]